MDWLTLIEEYGGWSWVIGGAILLAIELVVPGGVFVWLGISALIVGLASVLQDIAWQWQWGLFALLSIVTVTAWSVYVRRRGGTDTDQPFLNNRVKRLIGEVHTLSEPVENGQGRLRIGDSPWRVKGPDLAAGTRVKIVGAEGATLVVEPAGE